MNNTQRMYYQVRLANILIKAGKNKRFYHSLEVAKLAEEMANRFHLDAEKAYLAGLLHDVARSLDLPQLFYFAGLAKIPIKETYWSSPTLLHAPVGAYFLEREFGIEDKEILSSVKNHTLGAPGMSDLDKVIYLADMLEPGRKWQGIEALRKLAKEDLDLAMKKSLALSIAWLKEKGKVLDDQTFETYEYFCSLVAQKELKKGGIGLNERDLLLKCVELAKEKKAFDILSMEIRGISVIADYFLLMSASNPTQAKTICDYIDEEMTNAGRSPLRKEGYTDARWVILDFGVLLVHIFQPQERDYYNLERLWADAPVERF